METKGCYGNILLQWLLTKYVKLPSESFFLISPGVLELWRKTLGGRVPPRHG